MDLTFAIISVIFLLAVEVFFSGGEIAIVVADKMKLKAREDAGHTGAAAAMWFVRHPAHFFSTVILGTNISVVAASTVATFYLISHYGESSEIWALLLSPVVLVFGEVLPKSLFQHYSNRLAEKIGPPLIASMYAMYPLVWVLSKLTHVLLGGVAQHFGNEPRITREELSLIISSSESPDVRPSERKMVQKILELANLRVQNVMVPLALVESVPINTSREAALSVFDLKGFSKLPVFEYRAYNIVGMLDCLDCLFGEGREVKELIQPVPYVPNTMRLHELYLLMRDRREQIVIVVDEYGAAAGLVTLEDVLEEIVGDIKDEYELGRQHWRILGDGRFVASGRVEIGEAREKLGVDIPKGNYETIAGFILEKFGYIPKAGEKTHAGALEFIVRRATERMVIEVEIIKH